jgi:plastocyanin
MTRLRAKRFGEAPQLRRQGAIAIVVMVLVVAAGGALMSFSWGPPSGGPSREIRLVAKGMAFYLESDPSTPNPTLEVKAGERVRISLQNDDRGMTHDFAVLALQSGLKAIDWNERAELVLEAPEQPGIYEYVCRPHNPMMKGTLRVR